MVDNHQIRIGARPTDPPNAADRRRRPQAVHVSDDTNAREASIEAFGFEALSFLHAASRTLGKAADLDDPSALPRLMKDITQTDAMKNLLPLLGPNTRFARLLRVLNTLSAYQAETEHGKGRNVPSNYHNTAAPTPGSNTTTPAPTEPVVHTVAQVTATTPSYLQAALAPPRPLTKLPIVHAGNPHPALSPDVPLARRLRAQIARTNLRLRGHESKSFVRVQFQEEVKGPAHFREALNTGGFPAPSVVLSTSNRKTLYVCAARSALPHAQHAYRNYAAALLRDGITAPQAEFAIINDITEHWSAPGPIQDVFYHNRNEILRLEALGDKWRPARFFAHHLRELDKTLLASLKTHNLGSNIPALEEPHADPTRPSKRPHTATIIPDTYDAAREGPPSDPLTTTTPRNSTQSPSPCGTLTTSLPTSTPVAATDDPADSRTLDDMEES